MMDDHHGLADFKRLIKDLGATLVAQPPPVGGQ